MPDFVQDHLVIEQCYLGNNSVNYDLGINNLPDFAPNRENRNTLDGNARDILNSTNKPVPLDLPIRSQGAFPLDLPIGNSTVNGPRNCQPVSEVSII